MKADRILCYVTLAGMVALAVISIARAEQYGKARFKYIDKTHNTARAKAMAKVVRDINLSGDMPNPLCPATSTIQLLTDDQQTGLAELDCENWTQRRTGFVYVDKQAARAGVKRALLKPTRRGGKFKAIFKGAEYYPDRINEPTGGTELWFTVDDFIYCRGLYAGTALSKVPSNVPGRIIFKGHANPCGPNIPTVTQTPVRTSTTAPQPTQTPVAPTNTEVADTPTETPDATQNPTSVAQCSGADTCSNDLQCGNNKVCCDGFCSLTQKCCRPDTGATTCCKSACVSGQCPG